MRLGFIFALVLMCATSLLAPLAAYAQAEAVPETVTIEKAKVLEATNQHTVIVPGTDTPSTVQTLKAQILEGNEKGAVVTFDNDYTQLKTGDLFYIRHLIGNDVDGRDYYTVSDAYRLNVLLGLLIVFLALLFFFGGIQGIRGLVSLLGSFVLILFVLLPGILQGYSPILMSIGVASLIIVIGSYITHGFNKTTTAAVLGMIATVLITGLGAYYVIHIGNLSGFTTEENVYLNFNTQGSISMIGLLFGGIMIGLLGVLYDIAIGQAVTVEELFAAGKHMTRIEIYKRAIRIGREHIGALVNTLAIAYVGVALPLLLLVQQTYTTHNWGTILNSEMFATEAIRILIGSIGLILAVPITTSIASYMLSERAEQGSPIHHH
ncbi:MAG TPA: YibE/F family protein [Candidatus Paceibacterota bacterium]|nr:YibE/F family protein [Candidatus Paceibacterota bacterium]